MKIDFLVKRLHFSINHKEFHDTNNEMEKFWQQQRINLIFDRMPNLTQTVDTPKSKNMTK